MSILVVSDIHLSFDFLKKIQTWHYSAGLKQFDCVLVSGDIANVNHDGSDTPAVELQAEDNIRDVFKELENFLVPIYYIPGNHDPKCLYNEGGKKPQLSFKS